MQHNDFMHVDCGPLSTDLENGAAAQTGVTYDQTTTYTCNAGYYITTPSQSSLVVTCQDDGNWDGTRPTCTPVCESPFTYSLGGAY